MLQQVLIVCHKGRLRSVNLQLSSGLGLRWGRRTSEELGKARHLVRTSGLGGSLECVREVDGGVSCPGRRGASAEPLIGSPADRQLEPPPGITAHPERPSEAGRTGNPFTFSLQNHTSILLLFLLVFFCRGDAEMSR